MCATHLDDRLFSPDALPPLVKVAALLATGYAVHRSLSPPNPPPSPKTCIDNRTLFERAIRHVTFCSKMMTWAFVVADTLVTLHLAFPSALTSPFATVLLPSASWSSSSLSSPGSGPISDPRSGPYPFSRAHAVAVPSAAFLLGALLATMGGLLRVACFRALGSLFTFELTIHPTHRLVTDGPYSHVRHPSYTGVYATLLGATVAMLAPSAWLHEAWLAPSLCAAFRAAGSLVFAAAAADTDAGRPQHLHQEAGWCSAGVLGALLAWVFAAFWVTKVVYALRSTNKRVNTEDRELHRVFGAQWEEWAARVRWRLCPWVY